MIGTDHQAGGQVAHGLAREEHSVVREHDAVGAYKDLNAVSQEAPAVDHDAARRLEGDVDQDLALGLPDYEVAPDQPLVLTPDGRSYRVTGGFNLSVCLDDEHEPASAAPESAIMQVGGTGIEPATRAV